MPTRQPERADCCGGRILDTPDLIDSRDTAATLLDIAHQAVPLRAGVEPETWARRVAASRAVQYAELAAHTNAPGFLADHHHH